MSYTKGRFWKYQACECTCIFLGVSNASFLCSMLQLMQSSPRELQLPFASRYYCTPCIDLPVSGSVYFMEILYHTLFQDFLVCYNYASSNSGIIMPCRTAVVAPEARLTKPISKKIRGTYFRTEYLSNPIERIVRMIQGTSSRFPFSYRHPTLLCYLS